ncbi:MAG: hypothetical protein IPH93_09770 [Saprospiraceae bacterium]|nr:hypothetical protein [Saprospiraceae bacterium]MBK7812343.1 hypothetical protein [Saprospiraceae bacterium]MBK9632432.1 hypothetical protein [Saprospiraceae bacterium]
MGINTYNKRVTLRLMRFIDIKVLIWKDIQREFRSFHQLGAVIAFLSGTSYLVYFFSGKETFEEWNLLFWIVYLFVSFFTGYRVFEEELVKYRVLTYQLYHPNVIYLARNIYLFLLLVLLGILLFLIFNLLMPISVGYLFDWFLLLITFNIGNSIILSFNSFLSSQSVNQTLMFSVLVLPLTFPLFGAGFLTSLLLLQGGHILDSGSQLKIMVGINLFSIALVSILLPYIWKN